MSGPRIMALDLATTTGIAVGSVGEKPRFSTMRFAKEGDEHEDVFERALRWFAEYVQVDKPDAIYVEAPLNLGAAMGQTNANTVLRLNGLWAVIAAAAKVKRIKYRRARVQEIRKNFLGSGNLKGDEAKKRAFAMCGLLGWEPKNKDEGDSGALWHWAACIEAPSLAPMITPAMQRAVANRAGGAGIDNTEGLFKQLRAK